MADNNIPSSSPNPQYVDKSHWIFDPFGDKDDEDDENNQNTAKKRALDSIQNTFNSKLGL